MFWPQPLARWVGLTSECVREKGKHFKGNLTKHYSMKAYEGVAVSILVLLTFGTRGKPFARCLFRIKDVEGSNLARGTS
jgi:hypothetical protein